MGKFRTAIDDGKPEDGKAVKPANQVTGKTDKQEAVKPESSKAVNTESQDEADKEVSLTIKVPLSHRVHWLIEAKKRRTSLTKLISKYLTDELGLPD